MERLTALNAAEILSQIDLPIMILDPDLRLVFANNAYLSAVHRTADQLFGLHVFEAFPDTPERVAQVEDMFTRALAGEITYMAAQPYELLEPDGKIRTHIWRCVQEPIRDGQGKVTHMLQRAEDITEEAKLKAENEVMSQELDHRVRNMLSVIRSVAKISGQSAESVPAFVSDFADRLDAMARSFTTLQQNRWTGLDLGGIFSRELAVYNREGRPVSISGPEITLTVKSTKDASLIIHELGTNAAKHGCFSVPDGRLDISWTLEGEHLVIRWNETGLEGLTAPTRTGFGTRLLGFFPNVDFQRNFEPDGVKIIARMPVELVKRQGETEVDFRLE